MGSKSCQGAFRSMIFAGFSIFCRFRFLVLAHVIVSDGQKIISLVWFRRRFSSHELADFSNFNMHVCSWKKCQLRASHIGLNLLTAIRGCSSS